MEEDIASGMDGRGIWVSVEYFAPLMDYLARRTGHFVGVGFEKSGNRPGHGAWRPLQDFISLSL
jgi:hypothetical protein